MPRGYEHNDEFRALYEASGLTKQQVAGLLSSKLSTVIAWTKAETSKSSIGVPAWAVELFKLKLEKRQY